MGRNKRVKAEQRLVDASPKPQAGESPAAKAVLAGVVTALFVLRPLYPSEAVALKGDGLPVVMLWLLALTLWAVFVARGSIQRMRFASPDMAVLLLVLWHSVAALRAVAYESPRPALNMLWEWIGLGIAFFLARQAFSSGLQRRTVGAVMVALAVVVSIYGVYQYSVELPDTRESYQHASEQQLRDQGIWSPPGSPERQVFEQRLASLEPMATFALTNSLAGFLAPWALVALGVSIASARQLTITQRGLIASLLIPLGLCLLLTKSRSALLACACGTAALSAIWWIGRPTRARIRRGLLAAGTAAVLIVATVLAAVMTGGLDVEVFSEAPKSLGYRLQYWQASAAMIRDTPIFGCGPGNYQHRYTAYKLPEASEEIADPHNFLIEIWATAGTPALLALLGAGGTFCLCLLRSSKNDSLETEEPGSVDAMAISWGALGGLLLSLPVGMMSEAPPTWLVPLAALPLGAMFLTMLSPWVLRGDDSVRLWTLAASVLLLNLLFAGGIAFPGVATSLWLLAALALNASKCGQRSVSPRAGTLVLGGGLALVAACYFTGYKPTLVARTKIDGAIQAIRDGGDPRDLFLEAVTADPWAFEPRKFLADALYQQALLQPGAETWEEFDRAVQDTLVRAPRAASLRQLFGMMYCDGFRRSGSESRLAHAIPLLESAVSLYPTDCRKRADLAEAYLLLGNRSGYEQQRSEALRLDSLTPHSDKKLLPEQRQRFLRRNLAPEVRPSASD